MMALPLAAANLDWCPAPYPPPLMRLAADETLNLDHFTGVELRIEQSIFVDLVESEGTPVKRHRAVFIVSTGYVGPEVSTSLYHRRARDAL